MRVLLVTKPLSPPWDDSAKLVPLALLRQAAGRLGFRILVARGAPSEWPSTVRATPVAPAAGYRTSWKTRLDLSLAVLSHGREAAVIHFFFQPHAAACRTARWLARLAGRPTVHTALSAPSDAETARLLFADRTVALSAWTAERLMETGRPRPIVIPPALPDEAPTAASRADAARRAAGLDEPFVLYPGDYEFSGGHELLLEAWRGEARLPRLVFAGRDKTPAAAAARAALAARVAALGLERRVLLLGRVEDLPGLVAAARALLFPAASLYGKTDLPLVVLEAWRDGVPVLVRDLPPLAEAVGDGGAVLPAAASAWAGEVLRLEARRDDWALAGRRRWRARFSAADMAERYLGLYEELAGAAARRTGRGERARAAGASGAAGA